MCNVLWICMYCTSFQTRKLSVSGTLLNPSESEGFRIPETEAWEPSECNRIAARRRPILVLSSCLLQWIHCKRYANAFQIQYMREKITIRLVYSESYSRHILILYQKAYREGVGEDEMSTPRVPVQSLISRQWHVDDSRSSRVVLVGDFDASHDEKRIVPDFDELDAENHFPAFGQSSEPCGKILSA